ncbi:MAG: lipocalin-like domain-containing protein [Roseiflexaceae bacterium]
MLALLMLLSGCGAAAPHEPRAQLAVAEALGEPAGQGFARATSPRPFSFPTDHGPHREYAAEWWYYTGNLTSDDGRQYGFQLTFFRFGLAANATPRESAWAANEIYMAHFALSDIAGGKFYAFERFSRAAAGLAGAQAEPFRVWLEDWSSDGLGPTGTPMRIRAAQDGVALDLTLEAGKPIVLQGDQGLSQKSGEAGNASYYYSMTRMPASGTIQTPTNTSTVAVQGNAWMDREWSTSALGPDQVGWDWFALQLGDGREIMFYQLRLRNGQSDPYSKGILVAADGSTTLLKRDDVQLIVTNTWQSLRGTTYPAAWSLRIPSQAIDLQITPLLANQELPLSVTYWEGAVQISGTSTGRGYVELTGYADNGS